MKGLFFLLASIVIWFFCLIPANACSRVMHKSESAILVGRNFDWFEDAAVKLRVYPRGMVRHGNANINSKTWTSKYGSLVFVAFSIQDDKVPASTTDGINEKGLTVELNALRESDYGIRDASKEAISVLKWAQFYLDNFATVNEAVQFAASDSIQLEPYFFTRVGRHLGIHMSLADDSGDNAIIEYLGGKAHIYHGKQYKVMTNSPIYEEQLENLSRYIGLGGNQPLPGSSLSEDRFVRAAYYEKHLPSSHSLNEAINAVFSILENIAQPEGIVTIDRPEMSRTIWRNIVDLSQKTYYFQSRQQRQLISVSLDRFDLSGGSNQLEYIPAMHPKDIGDVSDKFK